MTKAMLNRLLAGLALAIAFSSTGAHAQFDNGYWDYDNWGGGYYDDTGYDDDWYYDYYESDYYDDWYGYGDTDNGWEYDAWEGEWEYEEDDWF